MPRERKRKSSSKKRPSEIDRLNKTIARALKGFRPPDDLTVSEWAEKKRRLSAESSAEPGLWKNRRTPYLVDVMDAFSDPKVRHIVMVASSQIGKSEALNNCIGYVIDEDPGSILFVHPTVGDAQEYSKLRIAPMIRDTPALRAKVSNPKARDSSNTITQKTYPGGILTLCGSTEAHALASKPIRYVFGDERDRWAASAGKEGDPWLLAMARQKNFYNAKSVEVSTPTIKGSSAIEKAYSKGTMERWCTRCPACGEYREIKWENIRFEYDAEVIDKAKTYKVRDISYVCPACGSVLTEKQIKGSESKWIAGNPAAYEQGVRSFWLNAFVSPWATWESIILSYLGALGDSRMMQVVYNTSFGELWEDRGEIQDEDTLMARREDYGTLQNGEPCDLPEGVLILTCGVDTQDNRLEYEVVGHGHFGETWGIRKGIIMGRPDDDATWQALDDVLDREYRFKDGYGIKISRTFIDEGGHFTQEVRERCRQRFEKQVFCIKGIGGSDRPFVDKPRQMKILKSDGRYGGTCWQYQIGVDSGKQRIMDNLKVQSPGAKYCHFPKRDDYGDAYFNGLLSERLTYQEGKKNPWQWVKIPGHERNEPLDIRNYALAAFQSLPRDLDATEHRLRLARSGATIPTRPAAGRAARPKKKESRLKSMYDSW